MYPCPLRLSVIMVPVVRATCPIVKEGKGLATNSLLAVKHFEICGITVRFSLQSRVNRAVAGRLHDLGCPFLYSRKFEREVEVRCPRMAESRIGAVQVRSARFVSQRHIMKNENDCNWI
jgi:hypothetical protein